MSIRQLALSLVTFTLSLTPALAARADVPPPCESCFFAKEGDACDLSPTKKGTCVKDTSSMCGLTCEETTETHGGCSTTAGALVPTGALWVIASLPILFLHHRRSRRRR